MKETVDLGEALPLENITPEQREEIVRETLYAAGKIFLFAYVSLGLKEGMVGGIVNDATGELYEMKFQKAQSNDGINQNWVKAISAATPPEGIKTPEGWIRVEDRLPQQLHNVIVFYDDGITGYISRGYYHSSPIEWSVQSYKGAINPKVTHWQPLPNAPTSE